MIPGTCFSTLPTFRSRLFGPLVGGFALRQKGTILAGMTLCRRHEFNRTMPVFRVVPGGKLLHPFTRPREVGKRTIRVGWCVLQRLEQSLRIGEMCSNTFPVVCCAQRYVICTAMDSNSCYERESNVSTYFLRRLFKFPVEIPSPNQARKVASLAHKCGGYVSSRPIEIDTNLARFHSEERLSRSWLYWPQ